MRKAAPKLCAACQAGSPGVFVGHAPGLVWPAYRAESLDERARPRPRRLLPSDGLRFGFWRSFLVSLLTGLVLSSIVILVSEEDSFSTRLGLCFVLSLPGWLAPLVWNRRAVALGAPGFWTVWGRFLKRLGLAAVALIALISLAFAIEGIRAAWAWQAVEAHLKQRREPLTFEDLVGPRVPDAQNFARHPLMDGLLSHTATNAPHLPVDWPAEDRGTPGSIAVSGAAFRRTQRRQSIAPHRARP